MPKNPGLPQAFFPKSNSRFSWEILVDLIIDINAASTICWYDTLNMMLHLLRNTIRNCASTLPLHCSAQTAECECRLQNITNLGLRFMHSDIWAISVIHCSLKCLCLHTVRDFWGVKLKTVSTAGSLVIKLQVQLRLVIELCKLRSNCSPLGFTSQFLIQLPLMSEVEAAQGLN